MVQNPPYKVGDLIKLLNGLTIEYLGPSNRYKSGTYSLCRYVKSKHGVPIVCRTRHHLHKSYFKNFYYSAEKHRWIYDDWILALDKKEENR